MNTYLVHINPTPGKDDRVVEVEAVDFFETTGGSLVFKSVKDSKPSPEGYDHHCSACFAPGTWNYVEPKK